MFSQPGSIGIDRLADQQFIANTNYFRLHMMQSKTIPSRTEKQPERNNKLLILDEISILATQLIQISS